MVHSFFPKSYPKILFQNATSDFTVMHRDLRTVCPCNVNDRKRKRENCVCSHVNVYFWGCYKKISCSIVMIQWSNLYLFSTLNEFNSQNLCSALSLQPWFCKSCKKNQQTTCIKTLQVSRESARAALESLHVLPVSGWDFSGCSHFPINPNMHNYDSSSSSGDISTFSYGGNKVHCSLSLDTMMHLKSGPQSQLTRLFWGLQSRN